MIWYTCSLRICCRLHFWMHRSKTVPTDEVDKGDLLLLTYSNGDAHHTQCVTSASGNGMSIAQVHFALADANPIVRPIGQFMLAVSAKLLGEETSNPGALSYMGNPVQRGVIDANGTFVRPGKVEADFMKAKRVLQRSWDFSKWIRQA